MGARAQVVKEYGATPERYAREGDSPEFDYQSAQTLVKQHKP